MSQPTPDLLDLAGTPNPLAPDYSRFRVTERILLTGHSHQAWPDVARAALLEAYDDAAEHVDTKWERAFLKAERVREAVRLWHDDPGGEVALGQNTHELVTRFLSALDLRRRPKLVTTDGEFHTLRRQLARLAEAGLALERIAVDPLDSLAERLARATNEKTAAVLVSAVLYETSRIVPNLATAAAACERHGAELLIDAYHATGCLPYPLATFGLANAWVVGGGYKYLQWGEGSCFLRLPPRAATMRPTVTGWFAEFELLETRPDPTRVAYPDSPTARFAGSTYDPTSHYRAARVADYFVEKGLTPERLRANYLRQVRRLAETFDAQRLPPAGIHRTRAQAPESLGGFLSLESVNRRRAAPGARERRHRLRPSRPPTPSWPRALRQRFPARYRDRAARRPDARYSPVALRNQRPTPQIATHPLHATTGIEGLQAGWTDDREASRRPQGSSFRACFRARRRRRTDTREATPGHPSFRSGS